MTALLPTGHVVTRDGVALFSRSAGAGPPVVLLASWSLSSLSWGPVMARLAAQGFRAMAYDRRGHGRSADPGGGMDYDTLADDLADVLAAHDLRAVTLIAMSGAAGEAVRYLTRHGASRIARLVLLGPTTRSCSSAPTIPSASRRRRWRRCVPRCSTTFPAGSRRMPAPSAAPMSPMRCSTPSAPMHSPPRSPRCWLFINPWPRPISAPNLRPSTCRCWSSRAMRMRPAPSTSRAIPPPPW
ncbi:MAG: alpha/beta hydrolase [Roseomonas sp.]|nr:alpha/beta hydrolase [Roseomonas sp.]